MHCPNCGSPIETSDLFCGECGTKLTQQSNNTKVNSTATSQQTLIYFI